MRRRPRSASTGLAVPLSMLDVAWLILLYTLVHATFLVSSVPLPELVASENPPATDAAPAGPQITVKNDGKVLYQEQPISLDQVAARIARDVVPPQKAELCVESDSQRRMSANVLQLLHDLSVAGVGDRVNLTFLRTQTGAP
jgi:biopolymer transport protein ExbD